jgi:hypothetical protein
VVGDDALAAEVEFTGTNSGPLRLSLGGMELPALVSRSHKRPGYGHVAVWPTLYRNPLRGDVMGPAGAVNPLTTRTPALGWFVRRRDQVAGVRGLIERTVLTKRVGTMAGDRFFVTVFARDRAALRQLADFDLDLFQATARAGDEGEGEEPRIEGLLSLEEIGRLVEAGYRVAVEATESSRSRAAEQVVQAQDFLKSMGM